MTSDFFFALIFILSALDAMRDGFRSDAYLVITNKQWHVIKWLSWYPLMLLLMFQCDGWRFYLGPVQGLVGWRFGLLWTPRRWDSMWFTKLNLLWNKFKIWRDK